MTGIATAAVRISTPSEWRLAGDLWPVARAPRRHDEADMLAMSVQFLAWALPPDAIAHHSPGEGKRTKRAQGELKRSGYQAGWPDIEVCWQGRVIFIELKSRTGSLSPAQRNTHNKLRYCGAEVITCRSVDEVEAALRGLGVPLQATVSGWMGEKLA